MYETDGKLSFLNKHFISGGSYYAWINTFPLENIFVGRDVLDESHLAFRYIQYYCLTDINKEIKEVIFNFSIHRDHAN